MTIIRGKPHCGKTLKTVKILVEKCGKALGISTSIIGEASVLDDMVNSCCVVGCHNNVGKKFGLCFYTFPRKDRTQYQYNVGFKL